MQTNGKTRPADVGQCCRRHGQCVWGYERGREGRWDRLSSDYIILKGLQHWKCGVKENMINTIAHFASA